MAGQEIPKVKEREFIRECIKLYRELPSLWNVKSKEYHDRVKKYVAYEILLSKYREMFPQASKDDVKKKFNSLRTNYRKELRKYLQSLKSGSNTYKPTLWYFEEFLFLQGQESASDLQSSTDTQFSIRSPGGESEHSSLDKSYTQEDTTTFGADHPPSTSDAVPKTRAKHLKLDDDLMKLAANRLREKPDKYQNWVLSCASDLNKMEQNTIAAIINEGQLGLSHCNTPQAKGIEEVSFKEEYVDMDDSECTVENTRLSADQSNNEDPILTAEPKRRKRKIEIEYNDTVQSDDSYVGASTSRSQRSLESRASRAAPSGGDRHDFFGKYIICKLRELPKQQLLLAEKLINEVLFEAECSQLTMTHKLINTHAELYNNTNP